MPRIDREERKQQETKLSSQEIEAFVKKIARYLDRLGKRYKAGTILRYDILRLASNDTTLTSLHLGGDEIGDKGAQLLAEALKRNRTLTSLHLGWNEIGDKGAQALAEALKRNRTLTSLDLGKNKIGAEGAQLLAEALITNTTLTSLDLGKNKIGAEGAQLLAKVLKRNTTLTSLDLGKNKIGAEGAQLLAKVLKRNTTLTSLDLGKNKIGAEGAQLLAEALKTNRTLTSLNLRGNQIGAEGAQLLAEALTTNTTLTSFNLYESEIGAEGKQYLDQIEEILKRNRVVAINNLTLESKEREEFVKRIESYLDRLGKRYKVGTILRYDILRLASNDATLTNLDLLLNKIGDKGAQELAEVLQTNTTLTSLHLWYNKIGNKGVKVLAEALTTNTTLTSLHLQHNKIEDEGAKALAAALKTNRTLTSLNLWYNKIGDKGAQALAEALKINTTLTSLNLGGNKIGDKGAQALAEALKTNITLTSLNLGRNKIGDKGAQALAEALKTNITLTSLDLDESKIGAKGQEYLNQIEKILKRNRVVAINNLFLESKQQEINQEVSNKEETKGNVVRNSPFVPGAGVDIKIHEGLDEKNKLINFINANPNLSQENLNKILNEYQKQIDKIQKDIEKSPQIKLELEQISANPQLNDYYHTVYNQLNQAFMGSIVMASDMLKVDQGMSGVAINSAGTPITTLIQKVGGETLKLFPFIGPLLSAVVVGTANFKHVREIKLDTKNISDLIQKVHIDTSSNPSLIAREIARNLTLINREEILNPPTKYQTAKGWKESLKNIMNKVEDNFTLAKTKILEILSGKYKNPTERLAAEKSSNILSHMLADKGISTIDIDEKGATIEKPERIKLTKTIKSKEELVTELLKIAQKDKNFVYTQLPITTTTTSTTTQNITISPISQRRITTSSNAELPNDNDDKEGFAKETEVKLLKERLKKLEEDIKKNSVKPIEAGDGLVYASDEKASGANQLLAEIYAELNDLRKQLKHIQDGVEEDKADIKENHDRLNKKGKPGSRTKAKEVSHLTKPKTKSTGCSPSNCHIL